MHFDVKFFITLSSLNSVSNKKGTKTIQIWSCRYHRRKKNKSSKKSENMIKCVSRADKRKSTRKAHRIYSSLIPDAIYCEFVCCPKNKK